ncbi:hypothetical protein, variant [Verruconis gallopava]|uniref:Heterokaryon incompatibility domain-containing protein n=1 Tax=Verruconis gallopava TaxID=253628 RepID=A0A0D1XIA5_9PEZI|nr:hypothetical protein, variant [Verruconis gallopava]KIW02006.1 hypothetical protein, variant [Verruconis gallopava]
MYCFPYPSSSGITPLRVRYWGSCPYSLTGPYTFDTFLDFALGVELLSRFFSLSSVPSNRRPELNVVAAVLQAWLFFGLACEALGRDVDHNEFVELGDGAAPQGTIDLRMPIRFWTELQTRWCDLQARLSEAEFEGKKSHLMRCLELAETTMCRQDLNGQNMDDEDLAQSYTVLQVTPRSKATQLLVRRMVQNGWCRKRLNFVQTTPMLYPGLYYMASFLPPRSEYEDHSSCTSIKCSITGRLLEPFHRDENCACKDIHVPLWQVARIVADGGIPLVKIVRSGGRELKLEVVPFTRTSRFTAISHVWADRQFGSTKNALPTCQVEYLDSLLASLPKQVEHWGWSDWCHIRSPSTDMIEPPSRAYDLFWIDTFCIPQDAAHIDLKRKAIDSMNLIYATASQTVVFDRGLQTLDVGQRPASLAHGGRPNFYSPNDHKLLDALSHIVASNWMGRAWTLQEGVLSGSLVFPLEGSLAYLRLLWPHFDEGLNSSNMPLLSKARYWFTIFWRLGDPHTPGNGVMTGSNPFPSHIRAQLFEFVKSSLNVDEHKSYIRGEADRAARFISSHSLLQSRSTTQVEDLPLILMNMSGMNGNSVPRSKSTDGRMQLLFYGLGTLPVELLFSECARPPNCAVDCWIPREIVPEKFYEKHKLKLTPKGFVFDSEPGCKPLQFYLLAPFSVHQDGFIIYVPFEDAKIKCLAKPRPSKSDAAQFNPAVERCVVLSDAPFDRRGALFIVSRTVDNDVFMHFECPILCSTADEADEDDVIDRAHEAMPVARQAVPGTNFIIEKSNTPQTLRLARPQNPEQYSDRLIVIQQLICMALLYFERRLVNEEYLSSSWIRLALWGLFVHMQFRWVDGALHMFVHHAWVRTYSPTWNPDGRWRWFWKLSNYEPPIPFRTMMKFYCQVLFFTSAALGFWNGVAMVTTYWWPLFPKDELGHMYVTASLAKLVSRLMF